MTNKRLLIFAVSVIVVSWLIILFYRGFNDPDEGRYSEIPREMVVSGNWLEMRMLGFRYYEKPPLAYWLVAAAIKIFGPYDWAVRVPLLVSGLLALIALWNLAVDKMGRERGVMAFLVMASTIGFIAGNGLLLTDSFLLTFFTLTSIALYRAFERPPSRRANAWLLIAVLASAMGFFTKGAVAIVLPAAILFFWLLWEKRLKDFLRPSVFVAGLFLFLLLVPILWVVERHNPGFFRHFILEEHVARFTGTRPTQLHPEPFWFFLMVLPLLLLPWTLFLLRAVGTMRERRALQQDSFARFLLVWAAVVVCFFSAGTGKLMSYILPAIPPIGLLLGRWGVGEPPAERGGWDRRLWNIGAAAFPALALVIFALWGIAYFRLIPERVYAISSISVVALIPVLAVMIYASIRKFKFDFSGLLFLNAGILLSCALLLSPLAGKDFNVLLHINSSHVYKRLAKELKPDDTLVVFWSYRPALPFYTGRMYVPFQERNELEFGMNMEPERRAWLDNKEDLFALLRNARGRVFAIVEPRDISEKFAALQLNVKETLLPSDPDTVVYELIKPNGHEKRNNIN